MYNTLQLMSNNHKFMTRIQDALQDNGLLRFYLRSKMVYFVAGLQGVAKALILGSESTLSYQRLWYTYEHE